MVKVILVILSLTVACFACFMSFTNNSAEETLDYILEYADRRGYMQDALEIVSCDSIDDIGFTTWKDGLILTYGKVEVYLRKNDLEVQDVLDKLKFLHLEIKQTDSGEYKVYYDGEPVQKLAANK